MRTYGLYEVFVRNDKVSSDRIALVDGDSTLSFNELHIHVLRTATFLQRQGVQKGDRIALLCMNRLEFFILFGAVAKLGAILVPLNWRLSQDELRYIVGDCTPGLFFCDHTHKERATELAEHCSVGLVDLSLLLNDELSVTADAENNSMDDITNGDSPLCIIYTAAVEGYPRGAVLSHNNLLAANLQVITSMGLTASDVNLNMLPLFHITGLNLALAVMQAGGKNIILEKYDEHRTLQLTALEKVTVWGSFPPILTRIITQLEKGPHDISSLKYIVGLDGPDTIKHIEELSSANFWILYGQSETTGFVTFGKASEKLGSAGKQGGLTSYCLLDENDCDVEVGKVGEIAVRGPLVFQGYWNLPKVNKRTFRSDWHHTGDLGMMDADGFLYFKGRKPEKDLIKPGGENVYPAEVETAILAHDDVKAVCVIGVPDPQFGEGIKAICVLEDNRKLEKKDLIEFVAGRIARYKKPRYVEFVESLPQNNNAIDRKKVKQLWGEES